MNSLRQCKIVSYVKPDDCGFPVISADFNSGPLSKNEAKDVNCELFCDDPEEERKTLLLRRKRQLYQGTTVSQTEAICNRLLMVVSKNTGSAKLIPYSPCQLSNVFLSKRSRSEKTQENDLSASRSRLAQKFGSKASKKAYEVAARIRATTAVGDGTKLEETVIDKASTLMDEDVEVQPENFLVTQLLPPCDRQTQELTDVYPLHGLLSKGELADLKPAAEMLIDQPPDEKNLDFFMYPFFSSIGPKKTVLQVQLLLYANSLVTFTRYTKHELNKKEKIASLSPHSKLIATKILKSFSMFAENKRVRTQELTDKAVCHTIVAILLACEYKLHLDWLSSCLRGYRQKQLLTLVRLVGLVAGSGNKNVHFLKIPLPPLPSSNIKRRK